MENKNFVVAIDLGSRNVAVTVGSKDADGKLHIDDFALREVKGVTCGEIKNIDDVSKSIREAIAEVETRLGIKITEAFAGISGQHIRCAKNDYYVNIGNDGEISREDVQKLNDNMRNVQAPDGRRIIDFIPQNYVINGQEEVSNPVGRFGRKLEATFNFIIGEASAIDRLEKAFTKENLKLSKLFANPLVAADAVVLPDEKELGVAVIDMGAGTTDICIYLDNIPRQIAVVPLGADAINKDIRAYGILERHIEELKVNYGSAVSEGASADKLIKVPGHMPQEISFYNLATIIESRLMDIMDYVMAEIKHAGYEGKLAAGLVLTGGCARMRDIDKLVREHTGLQVRIAAPDVQVSEDSAALAADPRLATSIGLLLKGLQQGKTSRVEVVKKIPSVGPVQQPVPPADPAHTKRTPQPPVTTSTSKEDTYEDDFDDDGLDTDGKGGKKGLGGWLKGVLGNVTKQFDVIDDDNMI